MCFSGLVCWYAIENSRLLLRDLEFGSRNEPPVLGGVRAQESNCAWRYEGLAVPVGFTGKLLAAARWLKDSLRRIERLLGTDLDSPESRTSLHVALLARG